ncbi:GNAT family N-acetyltransferase [Streptomyces griseus]|uniref:GNAT family N-acetyltransferase n=1 Tax=Streptomyces TaxID=1883 RepID=UPI00080590C6|nr:GNAT family N-acetyltransferase [Streptomyces sp. MnatMP-M77]MYT78673.1 GNAT family N-acetyltransferase [Streptomyces sp. SID8364]NEB55024.1 GNAT family N-acetyltransferase [Streptomyces griseus]SBV06861.1 L-amino acid N-acyltransferase YncA [Streptomyces sp. MnatMP-M77]
MSATDSTGAGRPDHRGVRLRPATPKDAEAVTKVFLASRAAAMPYLPRIHSDEDTLAWITHVVLPTSTGVWVAEEAGGGLLGFAVLAGDGELDHLYLRPDALRRGIGSRLLAEVRGAAEGALTLYVFQRNAAARAFYERHGFTAVAFDDGSRNEENEPDVLYRWVP